MTDCIAIIDIGKTNKKILLFDASYNVIYRKSIRFQELVDDDGFACDDIDAIEKWIFSEIKNVQEQGIYNIKAINFSTHGATVVYLDKNGERVAPVYNYLKTLEDIDFKSLYDKCGGIDHFSRQTASPAYGMLNSGIQMYWLKYKKPQHWKKVAHILHYPQYLSYLFTKKATADFTSIGAHTALWNFDQMNYHSWVNDEGIKLPNPEDGSKATVVEVNGQQIAVGMGLHDSSASIVPLLRKSKDEFVLLSTGTWIICMNPFSKEKLTIEQLQKNCLCFMTPSRQQVKSSMRFLGHAHELYVEALSAYFGVDIDTHMTLELDKDLTKKTMESDKTYLLPEVVDGNFKVDTKTLASFDLYQDAYCQLMFEISTKVVNSVQLILDKESAIKHLYLSGGFNNNSWFVYFIQQLMPNFSLELSDIKNESALGAALLMESHLITDLNN